MEKIKTDFEKVTNDNVAPLKREMTVNSQSVVLESYAAAIRSLHSSVYLQCISEWSDTNGKFLPFLGTRGICLTFHNQAHPGHSL